MTIIVEGVMAKYLFIAQADCVDKTREEEFREWYDDVHVPDILVTPGIVQASRYENIDPDGNKRPQYMVIYEIETDDIDAFKDALDQTVKKVDAAGRVTDLLVPEKAYPFALTFYRQVTHFKKPPER
jgi:hypothetical protein